MITSIKGTFLSFAEDQWRSTSNTLALISIVSYVTAITYHNTLPKASPHFGRSSNYLPRFLRIGRGAGTLPAQILASSDSLAPLRIKIHILRLSYHALDLCKCAFFQNVSCGIHANARCIGRAEVFTTRRCLVSDGARNEWRQRAMRQARAHSSFASSPHKPATNIFFTA